MTVCHSRSQSPRFVWSAVETRGRNLKKNVELWGREWHTVSVRMAHSERALYMRDKGAKSHRRRLFFRASFTSKCSSRSSLDEMAASSCIDRFTVLWSNR